MAQFETSFIPKKQTPTSVRSTKRKRSGLGLLGFISFIILLFSLIGTGGLYLYKIVLETNIEKMSASIARVQEAIDPELIGTLRDVDGRIETSKILLSERLVASPIFRLLEEETLKNVGFDELRYGVDDSGQATLQLRGAAEDYSTLALQSDIFGEAQAFEEPLFENLRLDERGNVTFSFKTPIARSLILFENNLDAVSQPFLNEASLPAVSGSEEAALDDQTQEDLDGLTEGLDELLNGLNF